MCVSKLWVGCTEDFVPCSTRQPPTPTTSRHTVRKLLLIASRHAAAVLQLAYQRLATWRLAMTEIHRHMAQSLCHNRHCTARSGSGGLVAQALGLKGYR